MNKSSEATDTTHRTHQARTPVHKPEEATDGAHMTQQVRT